MSKATVKIKVHEAKGLTPTNFSGTTDAYCQITIFHGGLSSSDDTAVLPDTLDPKWSHDAVFENIEDIEKGELVIVDSSTEAFLGKIKLKASLFKPDKKAKKEWHTLEKCEGMDSVQGKIQVTVNVEVDKKAAKAEKKLKKKGGPLPNKLLVEVVQAKGIKAEDFGFTGGTSDPFVTLKIKGQEETTEVKSATLTPVWNTKYTFKGITDVGAELEVWMYDKDTFSNTFLGQCKIPLTAKTVAVNAKNVGQAREWYTLLGEKNEKEERGEIQLCIDWVHDPKLVSGGGGGAGFDETAEPKNEFERRRLERSKGGTRRGAAALSTDEERKKHNEERKKEEEAAAAQLKLIQEMDAKMVNGDYQVQVSGPLEPNGCYTHVHAFARSFTHVFVHSLHSLAPGAHHRGSSAQGRGLQWQLRPRLHRRVHGTEEGHVDQRAVDRRRVGRGPLLQLQGRGQGRTGRRHRQRQGRTAASDAVPVMQCQ
jgi:hypothetical protein